MVRLSKDTIDASNDLGSAVLEKDPELKEPPLYQVILINDDYTCLLYTSPSPRDRG